MDKVIEITNRAVADYGFRQAVIYGSADIALRWGLTAPEQEALEGMAVELLSALPIPVPPEDIAVEQSRLEALIRATR